MPRSGAWRRSNWGYEDGTGLLLSGPYFFYFITFLSDAVLPCFCPFKTPARDNQKALQGTIGHKQTHKATVRLISLPEAGKKSTSKAAFAYLKLIKKDIACLLTGH